MNVYILYYDNGEPYEDAYTNVGTTGERMSSFKYCLMCKSFYSDHESFCHRCGRRL